MTTSEQIYLMHDWLIVYHVQTIICMGFGIKYISMISVQIMKCMWTWQHNAPVHNDVCADDDLRVNLAQADQLIRYIMMSVQMMTCVSTWHEQNSCASCSMRTISWTLWWSRWRLCMHGGATTSPTTSSKLSVYFVFHSLMIPKVSSEKMSSGHDWITLRLKIWWPQQKLCSDFWGKTEYCSLFALVTRVASF